MAGQVIRVGEVEFVLGTGERDVEEAALFFEHVLVIGFEDAAVGEKEGRLGIRDLRFGEQKIEIGGRVRTAVRMADDLDGLKSGWQKCDGGACWVWRLC
jgi:hypothetical protein